MQQCDGQIQPPKQSQPSTSGGTRSLLLRISFMRPFRRLGAGSFIGIAAHRTLQTFFPAPVQLCDWVTVTDLTKLSIIWPKNKGQAGGSEDGDDRSHLSGPSLSLSVFMFPVLSEPLCSDEVVWAALILPLLRMKKLRPGLLRVTCEITAPGTLSGQWEQRMLFTLRL